MEELKEYLSTIKDRRDYVTLARSYVQVHFPYLDDSATCHMLSQASMSIR